MAAKGKEQVLLIRPGEEDRNGDPIADSVEVGFLEQCIVWPRVSTEVMAEGTTITEGYNVWVPFSQNRAIIDEVVEITGVDRVRVRGKDWQVDGTPADQRTAKSKRLGVQMVVKRVA